MYCANNIQVSNLISNVLAVSERENECKAEIKFQLESSFQKDPERKLFYKKYNRKYEEERISLNHRKVPTIYYYPKYHNILSVQLLSALSTETDSKHPTTGFQQRFVPAQGDCITFKTKRNFAAYLSENGYISFISETATTIDLLLSEQFHAPLTTDKTYPLFVSPYNTIYKIPRSNL